jgi:hypothetical protein
MITMRARFLAGSLLAVATAASAASVTTYQVTGPVLANTPDSITVQKGKEKWEIAKGVETQASGPVNVGDKVTITYRMTAASIELKSNGKSSTKSKKTH